MARQYVLLRLPRGHLTILAWAPTQRLSSNHTTTETVMTFRKCYFAHYNDTLVTNLTTRLNEFWRSISNKLGGNRIKVLFEYTLFSSAGDNSATQRFERTSNYFTFLNPQVSMVACYLPAPRWESLLSIWINIADQSRRLTPYLAPL